MRWNVVCSERGYLDVGVGVGLGVIFGDAVV